MMSHAQLSISPNAEADRVTVEEQTIMSADGNEFVATLYEKSGAQIRSTVLIHGATATPQAYYRRFAQYLADSGHRVLTYDYRGVGRSRSGSLRNFQADLRDWGRDAQAMIARARTFPEPLVSIGHSFGGQLLGLIDEAAGVDGAVLVASQLGAMRHWPWSAQIGLGLAWYAAVPLSTKLLGYAPGWLGLGVDLPGGVARQWAEWCRSDNYLCDFVEEAETRFAALSAPTLSYTFTDDTYVPLPAAEALLSRLSKADLVHRRIDPRSLGVSKIDHFGFFREPMRDRLWPELLQFVDDIATDKPATARLRDLPDFARRRFTISEAEVMRDLDYGR